MSEAAPVRRDVLIRRLFGCCEFAAFVRPAAGCFQPGNVPVRPLFWVEVLDKLLNSGFDRLFHPLQSSQGLRKLFTYGTHSLYVEEKPSKKIIDLRLDIEFLLHNDENHGFHLLGGVCGSLTPIFWIFFVFNPYKSSV